MKSLLALSVTIAALLVSTGCKKEVSATVNCKVAEGGTVNCTITQTKGTAEIEVCWEFKVSCENGATLDAPKTCGNVKDGQTTAVTITPDKVKIAGPTCDKVKTAEVVNTSWTAK